MSGCEKYLNASPEDFSSHINAIVDDIGTAVYDEIHIAVMNAANDVQSTIEREVPLDTEQENEVRVWRRNLDIDITTLNTDTWDGNDVRMVIMDHVHGELGRLYQRANSLPDPNNVSKLMDKIKANLYGTGFVASNQSNGTEIGGEGLLGAATDEAWSLRTDALADWDSATAKAFKTEFLENAQLKIKKQREQLNTLANLVDLYLGAVLTARKDLDSIAHGGRDAAQNMSGTCGQGADGNANDKETDITIGATLGMIAGAAAVTAALTSGNIAMAAGATSGTATFYQSAVGGDEPKGDYHSFGAVNWKELLRKIAKSTEDVESSLDEACRSISDKAGLRVKELTDKAERDKFYVVTVGDKGSS